ncbi:MAG: hypothetical protein EOO47_19020 [Flavobacterium sp.]|nr:MAG: hypothetical protein EOO47_19020 [Flavobacterium sp.]
MKFKITLAICFLTILFGFSAFKMDDDPFTLLLKKLDDYTSKFPQEKVHIHLDKPYYAIGDDIWFKGYVVDAKTAAPAQMSKVLYVELKLPHQGLHQLHA